MSKVPDYHLVTATKPEGFVWPVATTGWLKPFASWTDEDRAARHWYSGWWGIDREFKVLEHANMAVKVHRSASAAKACATKLRGFGFEATVTKMEMVPA